MSKEPSDMFPWIIPFSKILDLEKIQGFSNKSVMGGLDKFLTRWAESLQNFSSIHNLPTESHSSLYVDLSLDERPLWIDNWRKLLEVTLEDGSLIETNELNENNYTKVNLASQDLVALNAPLLRKPPVGLQIDAPIDRLKGVDAKLTTRFKRLDVATVKDQLY